MLLGRQKHKSHQPSQDHCPWNVLPFPLGFTKFALISWWPDPERAQSRSEKLFHSKSSAVIFTLASCLVPPAPLCVGMFTFPLAIKAQRGFRCAQPHRTHAACPGWHSPVLCWAFSPCSSTPRLGKVVAPLQTVMVSHFIFIFPLTYDLEKPKLRASECNCVIKYTHVLTSNLSLVPVPEVELGNI